MRIKWLRQALADLAEITEYIGRDDPAVAADVVRRIRARARMLRDHPALGRPARLEDARELVLLDLPYLLPYRVVGEEVRILRVMHTRRRPR